jgi:hypothetical protein
MVPVSLACRPRAPRIWWTAGWPASTHSWNSSRGSRISKQALEVGGLLVDHVGAVAADGASSDRGLFGVVGGLLDVFAFALSAALEVLEVDALAVVVRDGVGFPAFVVGEL